METNLVSCYILSIFHSRLDRLSTFFFLILYCWCFLLFKDCRKIFLFLLERPEFSSISSHGAELSRSISQGPALQDFNREHRPDCILLSEIKVGYSNRIDSFFLFSFFFFFL